MKFEIDLAKHKEMIDTFIAHCKKKDDSDAGAIGGRWEYCFIPTGLGVITVIRDNITGSELNLTEFDKW